MAQPDPDASIPRPRSRRARPENPDSFVRGGTVGARRLVLLGQAAETRQAGERADLARVKATRQRGRAVPGGAGEAGAGLGIGAGKRTTRAARSEAERGRRGAQAAARALARHDRLDTAAALLPEMRVAHCQRTPVGGLVEVLYHPEHGAASFGGLQTCGSAWCCPCCAAKIGARRTEEIKATVASWRKRGGAVLMLTLTLQHHRGRQLADLLDKMQRALHTMKRDRRWQLFGNRIGLMGDITAEEINIGENGWHPHFHILLFIADNTKKGRYFHEKWIRRRWSQCLDSVGEYAREDIGAVLSDPGEAAEDYVSKTNNGWGAAAELAGKEAKQGRNGSLTPSQILDAAAKGDEGMKEAYQEYAYATKGRHWIRFSKGLRQLCGLEEEKSEEELATEQTEIAVNLVTLTRTQWKVVIGNALRGELLKIAHSGDPFRVHMWCESYGIELSKWQIECNSVPYEEAPGIT